jgi:membrane associated rhomboid family serine protease
MLQDRPYMRDSYTRRRTSALTWLLSAVAASFVVQMIFARSLPIGLEWNLGLSPMGIRAGHVWTLVTYGFLHSTDYLLQVFAYLLVIYFAGREVLPILGGRRFLALYAAALASGGALWLAVHWRHPEVLMGASAGVSALVILYACFYPNRETTFLLFFFLPVTLKPKYIAFALVAVDLCGCVFYEILGATSPLYAAHSAHLGGMAAAWIYYRYLHDARWSLARARPEIELPRWMKQRKAARAPAPAPAFSVNVGDRGHLRAEVDRILDKINSDGLGSLSADEKRILDEARDSISRR